MAISYPTILMIASRWKPENEETDYRPCCNSIIEQQKKKELIKAEVSNLQIELMLLAEKLSLFQMLVLIEEKVQETAQRGS